MRLLMILVVVLGAAGGAYYYTEYQQEPPTKLAELPPPPPPPPPPPTLSDEQVDALRRKLYDTNARIRSATLAEVANFAGGNAEELILERLRFDESRAIRQQAISLLVTRHTSASPDEEDPAVSELIAFGLRDTDHAVKLSALLGLRDVGARTQADAISFLLFDADADVRREAMTTLNSFLKNKPGTTRMMYKIPDQYEAVYQKAMAHARRAP